MRNLVVDIGNTLAKAALFEEKQMHEVFSLEVAELHKVLPILETLDFSASILSSVRDYPAEVRTYLSSVAPFIELDEDTGVPVVNVYETPATLGKDRLAAACGAYSLFPGLNVLVINTGTCITYDVVTARKEYLGGSISPGIMMRFRALHTFTGRLPLLSPEPGFNIPGKNTHDSLLTGVCLGVVEEVSGMINRYQEKYPGIKRVLSGGDRSFFENQLKSDIFVVPNIVLLGLNEILLYNV
jgi:type III pantothenate kinase